MKCTTYAIYMYTFLFQRQTIRAVQVTECVYKHNDSSLKYYVYGVDNTVYAPDYPEQSCCAIV